MNTYPSLNVAVYDLRKRGYRLDFFCESGLIICSPIELKTTFRNVTIDETYSFPSLHKPGTYNIIYAVTTEDGIRGIVHDCSGSTNYKKNAVPVGKRHSDKQVKQHHLMNSRPAYCPN
jgi:hypothetical protein